MDDLLPSQVRARILRSNAALRRAVGRIRALEAFGDAFEQAVRALAEALEETLELEDRILVPVLRGIDAWGPERVKRLTVWHLDQRARLDELAEVLGDGRPDDWGARARAFVDRLEADLAEHERIDLPEELLRELPIPCDLGGD